LFLAIRVSLLVSAFAALAQPAVAQPVTFDHVVFIAMENHEQTDIVGNPSAPYLNSLIAHYGLTANYTANLHPSLPNYMAVTGGQPAFTINCDDCRTDNPSIADSLETSGRTWAAYMEDMTGTCGTVNEGLYLVKHNPFVHYRAISDNPARCGRIVPFARLAADLSAGALANYVWITPNSCHDMHDCDVATGDAWLQSVVPSIVGSPAFGNGLLVIWWDEGTTNLGGGGRIPVVVVSSRTPAGTQSAIAADHYSALRTVEDNWGLPPLGQSASARPLSEFFNLLQRPGFEEYSVPALGLPGWVSDTPKRQTAAVSDTHQPHSGLKHGLCASAGASDCGLLQQVIAPATGSYTLTAYANADRAGALVGVNVNASLGGSAPIAVRGAGNYGAPYVMHFHASVGDAIVAWMYSPAAPGSAVIDDVAVVFEPAAGSSAPTGTAAWQSRDIGAVGVAGSTTLGSGSWTVLGAGGAAIWGFADAFRFTQQPLTGDGQITVRVDSLQNTTPFAKAGVMLRDGLGPDAAHVVLDIRPTNDVEFMQRPSAGSATTFLATATAPPPYWVRLARAGSTVTGFVSHDGVSWVPVGAASANLPATASAGVVVTSNDSSRLNMARFEGASVLPAPWTNQDVGAVGAIGNATSDGQTFTIAGAGATGVWGNADTFHFVFRTLSGDGQIVARLTGLQNTNAFAKAGIMMRDGLSPGAKNVILDVRPTTDVEFMQRSSGGGPTVFYATVNAPPPAWLRLVRSGGTISASVSADGVAWIAIGSTPAAMSSTIQVGLVVTSVSAGQLNLATFDNVSVR
jgi:regulation of enolase protein 1 (concanavalin A-like superfamily)